jgi:hypothetical protein
MSLRTHLELALVLCALTVGTVRADDGASGGQEEGVGAQIGRGVKEAAHGVAEGAKTVGHAVKEGAKEGWAATKRGGKKVGEGAKEVGTKVKEKSKEAWHAARGDGKAEEKVEEKK